MMNYIVLDLEWNQSPYGKECRVEHLPFEIIEIGAVKLDEELHVVSEFHRLIRPAVYQEIHYRISEITHMDMEELADRGEDFVTAIRQFLDWCGHEAIFCTWGPMDLTELQRNMVYHEVDIPWGIPLLYYDVQKLYSRRYGDGRVKQSLDVAVEELGINRERPFHRALDDAWYTGQVMISMGFEQMKDYTSMDYFRLPVSAADEVYLKFPEYTKYVSHSFSSRETAMKERSVTVLYCPECKRALRKKIRWFTANQKTYFALGYCPEHGAIRGKIRIKKTEDGRVFVIRTTKTVDEDGILELGEKRDEARKRRTEKNKIKKARLSD